MQFNITITIKHEFENELPEKSILIIEKEICEVCGKEFGNLQYMHNHVRQKKDEKHKKYYKKLMASK